MLRGLNQYGAQFFMHSGSPVRDDFPFAFHHQQEHKEQNMFIHILNISKGVKYKAYLD